MAPGPNRLRVVCRYAGLLILIHLFSAPTPAPVPYLASGLALPGPIEPVTGAFPLLSLLLMSLILLAIGGANAARDDLHALVQSAEHAPVGVMILDHEGHILAANPAASTLLGQTGDALKGESLARMLHPDDQRTVAYLLERLTTGAETSTQLELRCLKPDDTIGWLRISLARTAAETSPHLLVFLEDYTALKEMEQAFWEQIMRNELILQTASDGFCLLALDGKIIEANAAFAEITGYSQAQLTELSISDLAPAEQPDAFTRQFPVAMETGNHRFDARIKRADNTQVELAASLNLIDMGQSRIFFLSVRNMTEVYATQRALQQSQQMLQLVLNSVPTRVYWKNCDLQYQGCNQAFAQDAGLPGPATITGMTDYEMPWKIMADTLHEADSHVLQTGESTSGIEMTQVRADGLRYWIRISRVPLRDSDGAIIGVMGAYEDITVQKTAHDRLVHSEAQLQSIFNNAAAGIVLADVSGNFLRCNRRWAEMLGYTEEQVQRLDFWQVSLPDDHIATKHKLAAIARGESSAYHTEQQFKRQDGSTFWASVAANPILDEHGNTDAVVAIIYDITEHKRTEQAVHESEARYRSLFQDTPISLLEIDGSGVNVYLMELRQAYNITSYREHLYDHPEHVQACIDRFDLLEANRAALALFDVTDLSEFTDHIKRIFRQTNFEDFRLILIGLAESQQHFHHNMIGSTVTGEPRALSMQISTVSGHETTWNRVMVAIEDVTVRMETEVALRESEERYRRLFEEVPISLWEEDYSNVRQIIRDLERSGITDLDAYFQQNPDALEQCIASIQILDVNRATLEMYNKTDKSAFRGSLLEVLPEIERDSLRQEIVALATGKHHVTLETKRKILGETRFLIVNLTLAPGYEHNWKRVLVSLTDVTALKLAEAAEHEQRTLAEALRDTAAALVSSLDPEEVLNRILDNLDRVVPHDAANIALIEGDRMYIHNWRGYTPQQAELLKGMLIPMEYPSFQHMFRTGEPFLIRNIAEAPEKWVQTPETERVRSYAGVPIKAHGQVVGFLNLDSFTPGFYNPEHIERLQAFADQAAIAIENAQLYDAIRKHAAELQKRVEQRTAELEHERAQLQAILDAMGEGVVYTEGQTVRYVNNQTLIMTGYSAEDLIGPVNKLATSAIRLKDEELVANNSARLMAILARNRIWRGDALLIRRDGSTRDVSLTITLVGSPEDVPLSIVTVMRDVSQERALQAQKDRFIANASHELRTPITNMKMRLYLINKQPERRDEHMEVLRYVTSRMEKLVEELLDLSRFERGVLQLRMEATELNALIARVVQIEQVAAAEKGLTLALESEDTPVNATVDTNRITQVITNLINNAFNYTRPGGRVTVRLRTTTDSALIEVEDTGIGIPAEALDKIFEPFYRVNEEVARGTGLGLPISREIVELHGGELTVQSKEGVGSIFTVRLPLHQAGEDNAQAN